MRQGKIHCWATKVDKESIAHYALKANNTDVKMDTESKVFLSPNYFLSRMEFALDVFIKKLDFYSTEINIIDVRMSV